MQQITEKLRVEKGCSWCTDKVKKNLDGTTRNYCPYNECPYEELDEFEAYEDYFKSKGDPFEALRKKPISTEYRRYYMREYRKKKP
jgi:hypothetical protein